MLGVHVSPLLWQRRMKARRIPCMLPYAGAGPACDLDYDYHGVFSRRI